MTLTANALHSGIDRRSSGGELPPAPGTGMVLTWGVGSQGGGGSGWTGASSYITTPVFVPGLEGVVAVAAGIKQCYALKADGTVWGWAVNSAGSLGLGERGESVTVPTQITLFGQPAASPIPKVAAIASKPPALLCKMEEGPPFFGAILICGPSDFALTGLGEEGGGLPIVQLVPIESGKGPAGSLMGTPVTARLMCAGGFNTMFVKDEVIGGHLVSTVWRSGSKNGQNGGSGFLYVTKELHYEIGGEALFGTRAIEQIAATYQCTMLRLADGSVWIKGRNIYGMLGNNNFEGRELRELSGTTVTFKGTVVPGKSTETAFITAVSSFAGLANGMQLGVEPGASLSRFPAAEALPEAAKIERLINWRGAYKKQAWALGDGAEAGGKAWVVIKAMTEGESVEPKAGDVHWAEISPQAKGAEGLKIELSVKASSVTHEVVNGEWTASAGGKKVGLSEIWEPLREVKLPVGRKAVDIELSEYNSYVVLDNGEVLAWGRNDWGQCGVGTLTGDVSTGGNRASIITPKAMTGLGGKAVEVAASAPRLGSGEAGNPPAALIRLEDGSVKGCGSNEEGVLGDGTLGTRPTPVPLNFSGGPITMLAASIVNCLALVPKGTPTLPPLRTESTPSKGIIVKWRLPAGTRTETITVSVRLEEARPSFNLSCVTTSGSKVVKLTSPIQGASVFYEGMEIKSGTVFEHLVGIKKVQITTLVKPLNAERTEWEVKDAATSTGTVTATVGEGGGQHAQFKTMATVTYEGKAEEQVEITHAQLEGLFAKPDGSGAAWPNFSRNVEISVTSNYNAATLTSKAGQVAITYYEDEAATKEVAAGNAKALFFKLVWNPASTDSKGQATPGWYPWWGVKLNLGSLNATGQSIPNGVELSGSTGQYIGALEVAGEVLEAAVVSGYTDPWTPRTSGRHITAVVEEGLQAPLNTRKPYFAETYLYVGNRIAVERISEWTEFAASTKKVVLRRWTRRGPGELEKPVPISGWLRPGEEEGAAPGKPAYSGYTPQVADIGFALGVEELGENDTAIALNTALSNSTRLVRAAEGTAAEVPKEPKGVPLPAGDTWVPILADAFGGGSLWTTWKAKNDGAVLNSNELGGFRASQVRLGPNGLELIAKRGENADGLGRKYVCGLIDTTGSTPFNFRSLSGATFVFAVRAQWPLNTCEADPGWWWDGSEGGHEQEVDAPEGFGWHTDGSHEYGAGFPAVLLDGATVKEHTIFHTPEGVIGAFGFDPTKGMHDYVTVIGPGTAGQTKLSVYVDGVHKWDIETATPATAVLEHLIVSYGIRDSTVGNGFTTEGEERVATTRYVAVYAPSKQVGNFTGGGIAPGTTVK